MKKFKWTIEITVDETWVADGFNLSQGDHLQGLLSKMLPYSTSEEKSARIISEPDQNLIAKAQGYANAAEMLANV